MWQMVAEACCKLMNMLYLKDNLMRLFVCFPEVIFINCIIRYIRARQVSESFLFFRSREV